MILYCKDSLGCIDNNNIELINNIVLLTGCFCIGPGIDLRSAVLALGPWVNTADRESIQANTETTS